MKSQIRTKMSGTQIKSENTTQKYFYNKKQPQASDYPRQVKMRNTSQHFSKPGGLHMQNQRNSSDIAQILGPNYMGHKKATQPLNMGERHMRHLQQSKLENIQDDVHDQSILKNEDDSETETVAQPDEFYPIQSQSPLKENEDTVPMN